MSAQDSMTPEERQAFDLVRGLLIEEQEAGKRIQLLIGPFSAFTMIGFLQLCLRNPGVLESESLSASVRHLSDALAEAFRDTPLWDLVQLGYDATYDVEQKKT